MSMGNVISYIDEYAEDSIAKMPLGEVDFLLLAQLAYFNMSGIVPGLLEEKKSVSVRELTVHPARYRMFQDKWFGEDNTLLLQAMSESSRYRYMKLYFFSEVNDIKRETQFAAVTIRLMKHKVCIAFRGTDESIIGWKEDCNLTFQERIPAQELAACYLRMVARKTEGEIFLVGHSKGGNLAEYAYLHSSERIQQRVVAVYNFDGPGNPCATDGVSLRSHKQREQYSTKFYKVTTKQSPVGNLFEDSPNADVIDSHGIGFMQHNPYNWIVEAGRFVRLPREQQHRSMAEELLRHWIFRMETSKRKQVIESFFGLIESIGEDNFNSMGMEWKLCMWKFLVSAKEKHGENRGKDPNH